MREIKDNGYNLNISRYVNLSKEEEKIDLAEVHRQLVAIEKKIESARQKHNGFLAELGLNPV